MADESLTIQIQGDTSQAQQALSQLQNAIQHTTNASQLRTMGRQMNQYSQQIIRNQRMMTATARTESQNRINSMQEEISASRLRVQQMREAMQSQGSGIMGTFDFGNVISGFNGIANSISSVIDRFNILDDVARFAFNKLKEGIQEFLKIGHDFNKEMEQNAIAFETLLGSADKAKKMINDLSIMAAKTPFEFPELAKNAKMLKAMGFAAEGLPYVLKNIGDAAASTGLGAEGLDRITRAIAQMSAKGKISAEEMTGQLGEIVPAWDILAKKMGKSVAEVMDMAQKGTLDVNKSLEMLIDGFGERFPNLMDKMSSTFDGLMSTIRDNLQQISGLLQASFFEQFKGYAQQLAEGLSYMLNVLKQTGDPILAIQSTLLKVFGQETLNAIMPFVYGFVQIFQAMQTIIQASLTALVPMIVYVMQIIGPIFLTVANFVNYLAEAFSNLSPTMQMIIIAGVVVAGIFISLIPILITIGVAIAGVVIAVMTFGLELLAVGGAILAVIEIVAMMGTSLVVFGIALYNAWQNISGFKEYVINAFSEMASYISIIMGNVLTFLQSAWGILSKGFKATFGFIVKVVSVSFSLVLMLVNDALRMFAGFTEILAGTFAGNWEKVWNGVKMIFGKQMNMIIGIGEKAMNALINLVNGALGKLGRIKMPDWLPSIGGKKFEIPKIPNVKIGRFTWDTKGSGVKIGSSMLGSLKQSFNKALNIKDELKKFELPKLKEMKVDTSKPQKMFDNISKGLEKANKAGKGTGKTSKKMDDLAKKMEKLKKAKEAKKAIDGITDSMGKLNKKTKIPKVFDQMTNGMKKFNKIGKEAVKKNKGSADKIQEHLNKITEKVGGFVEAVQNQAESIVDFGDLFEKVVEKKFAGEKFIKAIQTQIEFLNKWKASLEDIGKRIGKTSALYRELLSRGPEAGSEIMAISKMSDQKLREYEILFEEKRSIAYDVGYEMEASREAQELQNKEMVINITGNKISDDYDVDQIANRIIQKLKVAGVY